MGFLFFAYVVLGFMMIPYFLNWSMPRRFVYSVFFPFVFPFTLLFAKKWNTRGVLVAKPDDILIVCYLATMVTMVGYGLMTQDGDMVLLGCIMGGLFAWW